MISEKQSEESNKFKVYCSYKLCCKFSIQSNKMSYVTSHGLGPYFKKKMLDDVKKVDKSVLIFDEQTNNQNKKQLDLLFR